MTLMHRHRATLLGTVVLAAVFAVPAQLIATQRDPTYESTVRLVIAPSAALVDPSAAIYAEDVLSRRTVTATLAEILASNRLHRDAAAAVGLTPAQADEYEFDAAAVPEANVVSLSVRGTSPAVTAELADALGQGGVTYFTELSGLYRVDIVQDAEIPDEPIGFAPWQLTLVAALAGLVIGALVGSRIDDRRLGVVAVADR